MRQIAVALEDYAAAHDGQLPPAAVYDKDGKALLSWRVPLLPYLEEDLPIHLDEPWDSPDNLSLLPRMPQVYRAVHYPSNESLPQRSSTFCQVFTGKGTAFDGTEGRYPEVFGAPAGSVFLVVEAAKPVPWTKPADIEYDDDQPLPQLGGVFVGGGMFSLFGENRPRGFCAALDNGQVIFVEPTVDPADLRRAIKRNEGNVPQKWK